MLSTSEEVDAVRILTIHKSKGLEFKTVIIPFCAWDLDDTRHGRRIWCQNREEGFRDLEYAPLNYSSKLADSHFREDYLSEHVKAYVDNLNLLYVAFTRAEQGVVCSALRTQDNERRETVRYWCFSLSSFGGKRDARMEFREFELDHRGETVDRR